MLLNCVGRPNAFMLPDMKLPKNFPMFVMENKDDG